MDRHKHSRNPLLLFWGLTGFFLLAAYINVFVPNALPPLILFFLILYLSLYLVTFYLIPHTRHALLITTGVVLYLGLRFLELRQPVYVLLLIASLVALEYLWKESS